MPNNEIVAINFGMKDIKDAELLVKVLKYRREYTAIKATYGRDLSNRVKS